MKQPDPLFKLRLPDHLRQALEKEAEAARRSLTAEILGRLEMSLTDTGERINKLEAEVFDGDRGNDELLGRVRSLEIELEKLTSYVFRMR